jgi:hypothetical protein
VFFAAASELESGATKQTYQNQSRFTAWAKLPVLEAGKTVSVVTVVLPTTEESQLKTMADSVHVVHEATGVKVQLPLREEVDISDSA